MQKLQEKEAGLVRAEATIVVLRGLAVVDAQFPDRYRVVPHAELIGRSEARQLLAQMPKPRVCVSEAESGSLRIDCRSIEDFFSIPSERLRNLEAVRGMIERKIRERLETLSPVSVEDWMVTIVAGDANVKVDLANYFKWITEYSFRGCVVTEEHLLDVNGRSPNLILRFQVSKGDSPDIEFTILPDLGGLG